MHQRSMESSELAQEMADFKSQVQKIVSFVCGNGSRERGEQTGR